MTNQPPSITPAEAEALAGELLRALTPHAGDPRAVARTMQTYANDLDGWPFAAACVAAVQLIFADCLTEPHPDANAPTGALALLAPAGGDAA